MKISDLTGIPRDHARATRTISGNVLIVGDQAGKGFSPAGGLQWGSAVDGSRVYTANSNREFKEWALGDSQSRL